MFTVPTIWTVTQRKAEKLEKCSSTEREQVSTSVQATMRDYAAIRWPSLNHKGRIARLADTLGFGHRRTRALYQNELGTAVRADEMTAVAALRKGVADGRGDREAGYRLLEARIAALEELIAGIDPSLVGRALDRSRAQAHGESAGIPRRRAGD